MLSGTCELLCYIYSALSPDLHSEAMAFAIVAQIDEQNTEITVDVTSSRNILTKF